MCLYYILLLSEVPFSKLLFLFFLQIEIKNHVFFSPINWDELNAKKITPPFNPNVVNSFFFISENIFTVI